MFKQKQDFITKDKPKENAFNIFYQLIYFKHN